MQRTAMQVGQRYVVEKIGEAVYAGVHDGLLVAADGTEFHGGKGCLRFVVQVDDDTKRVVLIGDGRDVVELAETKKAREKAEAEHQAMIKAQELGGRELMTSLGIEVFEGASYNRPDNAVMVKWIQKWEGPGHTIVEGLTVDMVRDIIHRAQQLELQEG